MIAIVYIVERGLLEQQAVLLQKSISKFISVNTKIQSFACCVRKGYQPTTETIRTLENHGALYVFENLNVQFDYFPLCNGIFATQYVAQKFSKHDGVLLVDTDTVFVNSLEPEAFQGCDVLIRPVDNKGIGSLGAADVNDKFWQKAYQIFSMDPASSSVTTTISQETIRPYYNSGFIFAKNETDFFCEWYKDFQCLMESDVRTRKDASRHRISYGFNEQMSISITLDRLGLTPTIASLKYNYPLPFRPILESRKDQSISLNKLVHLHYHKWFRHPGFLDHVFSREDKSSAKFSWLRKNSKFLPEISDQFKC